MSVIMFSGHLTKPFLLETQCLDLLSHKTVKPISINNNTYYVFYNPYADHDLNVIGWCLLGLAKKPCTGNLIIGKLNADLSQADIELITNYIDQEKDRWLIQICLMHTELAKEYIINKKGDYEKIRKTIESLRIAEQSLSANGIQPVMLEEPGNVYYIDTETTGLDPETDEIISISIVDENGCVVMDQLIHPKYHNTWDEAEEINHISPKMVENAPVFEAIEDNLLEILENASELIAYNADFHCSMIANSANDQIKRLLDKKCNCCMEYFAFWNGTCSDCYEDPTWETLSSAMSYYALKWIGLSHTSLSHAYACRSIWSKLKIL